VVAGSAASVALPVAVTGRDCTIQMVPLRSIAHSVSCGEPESGADLIVLGWRQHLAVVREAVTRALIPVRLRRFRLVVLRSRIRVDSDAAAGRGVDTNVDRR